MALPILLRELDYQISVNRQNNKRGEGCRMKKKIGTASFLRDESAVVTKDCGIWMNILYVTFLYLIKNLSRLYQDGVEVGSRSFCREQPCIVETAGVSMYMNK